MWKSYYSDNEEEVLQLLQWLGISTHLQLYHFRETGRGLRTKKNLLNGEVLISIPLDKMITRNSLVKLSDFNYPLHWSTQLMLSCFLIRESKKIKQMCSAKWGIDFCQSVFIQYLIKIQLLTQAFTYLHTYKQSL